jgi:hypothetical protein
MAPVKGVYGFRVKPGRFEDWRALAREGEKLSTRFGGRNLRALMPAAAGPQTPMCFASIDFASGADWGKFQDTTAREVESQVFTERMFGHLDSPADLLYTGIITEIPLSTESTGTGPIMDVWLTQPRPGRYLDAIAFGDEIAPRVLQDGARCVHVYGSGPAGSESGRLTFVGEYADFESYGRSHDASSSPEWMEIMQRAMAADAPMDLVQHTLFSEVLLH